MTAPGRDGTARGDPRATHEARRRRGLACLRGAPWSEMCARLMREFGRLIAMNTCVKCGGGLKAIEHRESYVVGGRTYEGSVHAERCSGCGEVYRNGADLLTLERAIALHLADHGPVDGAGLEFLRVALQLTGVELGKMLGVRNETVSRWENGKGPVDRNVWIVVGDLLRDEAAGRDDTLRRLRALEQPPAPGTVRVGRPAA